MLISLVLSFIFAAPFVQSNAKAEVVPAKDGVPIHYSVQGKGEPTLVFIHLLELRPALLGQPGSGVRKRPSSRRY